MSSTTTAAQTAQPFNLEEFCKANEREFRQLGGRVIDLSVPILCLLNDIAATHQPNHRQEHLIHTSHPFSSAQAVFGRASLPFYPFTSLTLLTMMARALKEDILVLSSLIVNLTLPML